jgi:hypothetical protein
VRDGDLELTLPSRPEHLATARAFAAATARHFEISGEPVEDLKVAISEACVDALVVGSPIRIRAEEADRTLRFTVDAPEGDDSERAELDALGAPARIELIASLFPDAAVDAGEGRRTIRFSLPLA